MRMYVFLDLDDTILQTRPKCPDGEPVHSAANGPDGAPLSFMTERQQAFLRLLAASATVIPTTARNLAAFRRVNLAFHSFAILDFGGVILLPDGTPDPAWDAAVRPQALALAEELHTMHESVERFIAGRALGARARVIADFDMPLYLVVKHPDGDCGALEVIRGQHLPSLDTARFFVHSNGNNLSLVPRFLGKERAVRHLLDRHLGPGPVLTIGVGDSLSDAAFLGLCDYSLVPRNGQLACHLLDSLRGP